MLSVLDGKNLNAAPTASKEYCAMLGRDGISFSSVNLFAHLCLPKMDLSLHQIHSHRVDSVLARVGVNAWRWVWHAWQNPNVLFNNCNNPVSTWRALVSEGRRFTPTLSPLTLDSFTAPENLPTRTSCLKRLLLSSFACCLALPERSGLSRHWFLVSFESCEVKEWFMRSWCKSTMRCPFLLFTRLNDVEISVSWF